MRDEIYKLFDTTQMTYAEIAGNLNIHITTVIRAIKTKYNKSEIKTRKSKNYASSKLGDKNPMTGLYGELHHAFKERVEDGNGYWMVLKPDWYMGRKGSRHVFEHQIVVCEALKLNAMPAGYCVHHIDGNKKNNQLVNLALMTVSAHMRLHQLERATTREKSRRE